jgi:hypothetical protein
VAYGLSLHPNPNYQPIIYLKVGCVLSVYSVCFSCACMYIAYYRQGESFRNAGGEAAGMLGGLPMQAGRRNIVGSKGERCI